LKVPNPNPNPALLVLNFDINRLIVILWIDVNTSRVILSLGARTKSNSIDNPDLFRALKGASNNLALITHIELPLLQGSLIWGGFYAIDMSYRRQVFSFFKEYYL